MFFYSQLHRHKYAKSEPKICSSILLKTAGRHEKKTTTRLYFYTETHQTDWISKSTHESIHAFMHGWEEDPANTRLERDRTRNRVVERIIHKKIRPQNGHVQVASSIKSDRSFVPTRFRSAVIDRHVFCLISPYPFFKTRNNAQSVETKVSMAKSWTNRKKWGKINATESASIRSTQ